jgi:hypothetical protein
MKNNFNILIIITLFIFVLRVHSLITLDSSTHNKFSDPVSEVIGFIEQNVTNITDLKILAEDAHIYRHYLDFNSIDFLRPYDYADPGFYLRRERAYINIEDKLADNFYDLVVIHHSSNYSDSSIKKLQNLGYNLHKLQTASVFTKKT